MNYFKNIKLFSCLLLYCESFIVCEANLKSLLKQDSLISSRFDTCPSLTFQSFIGLDNFCVSPKSDVINLLFNSPKTSKNNETKLSQSSPIGDKSIVACSFSKGQLANQVSSFASLYSFEQEGRVTGYITRPQYDIFKTYFQVKGIENLKFLEEAFPDWQSKNWLNPFPMNNHTSETIWNSIPKNSFLNIGPFPNHVKSIKNHLDVFRKFFAPKSVYIAEAHKRLHYITKKHRIQNNLSPTEKLTYVSIHVRRSDYEEYMNHFFGIGYVATTYFEKAINHFREKFKNVLFYVLSDDPEWVVDKIEPMGDEIYFLGSNLDHLRLKKISSKTLQIGVDFALLSQANHSILTYGTFGMWGAFLAGGHATIPSSHFKIDTSVHINQASIPNWEFI